RNHRPRFPGRHRRTERAHSALLAGLHISTMRSAHQTVSVTNSALLHLAVGHAARESLVFGWIELAGHTSLPVRLTATAAIVGVPAAIKPVRTRLHQACWCLVTRHRIRTSF